MNDITTLMKTWALFTRSHPDILEAIKDGYVIAAYDQGTGMIISQELIDGNLKMKVIEEAHLLPSNTAIQSVIAERTRQDAKWGEQNHEPQYWMGILGEEFGELCQAVNETVFNNGPEERKKGGYANMREEAVQVAAVAVAFVEYLDRKYGGDKE